MVKSIIDWSFCSIVAPKWMRSDSSSPLVADTEEVFQNKSEQFLILQKYIFIYNFRAVDQKFIPYYLGYLGWVNLLIIKIPMCSHQVYTPAH